MALTTNEVALLGPLGGAAITALGYLILARKQSHATNAAEESRDVAHQNKRQLDRIDERSERVEDHLSQFRHSYADHVVADAEAFAELRMAMMDRKTRQRRSGWVGPALGLGLLLLKGTRHRNK